MPPYRVSERLDAEKKEKLCNTNPDKVAMAMDWKHKNRASNHEQRNYETTDTPFATVITSLNLFSGYSDDLEQLQIS